MKKKLQILQNEIKSEKQKKGNNYFTLNMQDEIVKNCKPVEEQKIIVKMLIAFNLYYN